MSYEYEGEERRTTPTITDALIDQIAERAAEKALEKVYTAVGKSIVSKFLWMVGAATLAAAAWLNGHGVWK